MCVWVCCFGFVWCSCNFSRNGSLISWYSIDIFLTCVFHKKVYYLWCFHKNNYAIHLLQVYFLLQNVKSRYHLYATMNVVKVEMNTGQMCHGCLSTGRRTAPLGDCSVMFFSLVGPVLPYPIRVSWIPVQCVYINISVDYTLFVQSPVGTLALKYKPFRFAFSESRWCYSLLGM